MSLPTDDSPGIPDPFRNAPDRTRKLPSFGIDERDRRYARVRSLMALEGLDCILTPSTDTGDAQANSRYLSQMGTVGSGIPIGPWVVFPAHGEVTACVYFEREVKFWRGQLEWPTDIRWGDASQNVIDRVKELGLERGRIGIAGLWEHFYRPEGVVAPLSWERVRAGLPNAQFTSCNKLLDRARLVKGPQEIEVLARVAAANEAGMAAMMRVARPGAEEFEVWQAINSTLTAWTAEHPARIGLGANHRPANSSIGFATPVRLENGGFLNQEIEARYQGYRAQSNHTALVGDRNHEAYTRAVTASARVFHGLLGSLRPGLLLGELSDSYRRLAAAEGGEAHAMFVHTCGLGHNRPTLGVGNFPGLRHHFDSDWPIEAGWVFSIKTEVHLHGAQHWATIGDPILVEENSARRLGMRALEPLIAK